MESLTAADPRTVGQFRLRARLGAGGVGQVFLASSLAGRAYAAAIPTARFQLLKDTGHLPQLETPDQVLDAIWDFVGPAR